MAPNVSLSSTDNSNGSGSGGVKRRSHAAVQAAEAAASFITSSDRPFRNRVKDKYASIRSRINPEPTSNYINHNGNKEKLSPDSSALRRTHSAPMNSSSSSSNGIRNNNGMIRSASSNFLLRMQAQRERILHRQRQLERQFIYKVITWSILLVIGIYLCDEFDNYNTQSVDNELTTKGIRGGKKKGTHHVKKLKKKKPIQIDDDEVATWFNNHQHSIPPTIIFTYHTNLLTTPVEELVDEEDVALSQNVKNIISLHPESKVRFLNDDDCLNSIQYALGKDTNLTTYFTNESQGMYKADICRGAALYETGGLYFDIDIEPRMALWDVIAPRTEFVTTFVHKDSNHLGGFFQAFIGVTPRHEIMKRYLELFVKYYEGEVQVKGPLGVYFLRMAYDELYPVNEAKPDTVDLWQEIRYSPELFPDVKRKWGKRRACQMLVVAKAMEVGTFKREQMVPLFSHANGSRMCKDTNKNGKEKPNR